MTASSQSPSWEELLDWVEGHLSEHDAARVAAAVAKAGRANLPDLDWIETFQRLQRDISLDEPPPQVRSNLRNRFAEYAGKKRADAQEREEGPTLIQRLIGTLTFDSGLQPQPLGLRSGDTSGARQLIYSTEAADVLLNVQQVQADRITVSGQILPVTSAQADAFHIQLIADEITVATTRPDVAGTFVFNGVLPDTYQLSLESDSLTILIGPVKLSSP